MDADRLPRKFLSASVPGQKRRAAGVVLFEMLAGRRPFHVDNTEDHWLLRTMEKIRVDPAPELPRAAGDALNVLFRKALQKNPRERFANAIEMLAVFNEACENPDDVPPSLLSPVWGGLTPAGIPSSKMETESTTTGVDLIPSERRTPSDSARVFQAFTISVFPARVGTEVGVHGEAQRIQDIFLKSESVKVKTEPFPAVEHFLITLGRCAAYNIRILHFAGHGDARGGFVWEAGSRSGAQQAMNVHTFTAAVGGARESVECVFLNACNSLHVGRALKDQQRLRYVLCWLGKVKDTDSLAFSNDFYLFLEVGESARTYGGAFVRACAALDARFQEGRGRARPTPCLLWDDVLLDPVFVKRYGDRGEKSWVHGGDTPLPREEETSPPGELEAASAGGMWDTSGGDKGAAEGGGSSSGT